MERRADARFEDSNDEPIAPATTSKEAYAGGKSDHDATTSNPSFFEHESAKFFSSMRPAHEVGTVPQLIGVGFVVALIVVIMRRRANSGKEHHEKSIA